MQYLEARNLFEMHKDLNISYKLYIIDNNETYSIEIRHDKYILSTYTCEVKYTSTLQIDIVIFQIYHSSCDDLADLCHIFIDSKYITDDPHDLYTGIVKKHLVEIHTCIWHDFAKADQSHYFQHITKARCVLNVSGRTIHILVTGSIS